MSECERERELSNERVENVSKRIASVSEQSKRIESMSASDHIRIYLLFFWMHWPSIKRGLEFILFILLILSLSLYMLQD